MDQPGRAFVKSPFLDFFRFRCPREGDGMSCELIGRLLPCRPRFSLGTVSLTKECEHKQSRQPPNAASVNTSDDMLRMHCVILRYNCADHVWWDHLCADRVKTAPMVPTELQLSCSMVAFQLILMGKLRWLLGAPANLNYFTSGLSCWPF